MDDLVTPQKVVVVGAGPVGCLAALYAADRGDDVEIYELRGDLRDPTTTPLNFTKSINLAISERGINSMRCSKRPGFVEQILSQTIPMHGRMIHGRDKAGTLWENSQAYDVHGRAINALDRSCLNNTLLDELEKLPNVKLFFNHKLTGADFRTNKAWFERRMPGDPTGTPRLRSPDNHRLIALNRAPELEVNFDLLIGADGAHSAARFHMMKFARTDYQQEYIDTLWCEFHIPPTKNDEFRISPNHLHIWPGGQFMFIALPSVDKSFTCTLFAPSSHYDQLKKSPEQLLEFFDVHFPGVCPNLISWDNLLEQFGNNPHLPLISIKCNPYHFNSSVVIVGDAAHAVLPFYGQGLNAGLEDIRVLFETLDSNGVYSEENLEPEKRRAARERALEAYTQYRKPDAYAINDLSRQNFAEMRQGVRSPFYLLRKNAEEALDKYFPQLGWATQYSRVSFSNLRYSAVIQAAARQGGILSTVATTTAISLVLGGLYAMWKMQTITLLAAKAPKWFGRSG